MKTFNSEEHFVEELMQYIRKSLFPHQLKVLDKGLALQETTLTEIFFKSGKLLNGNNPLILKPNLLPEQVNDLDIDLEVDKFTEDEKYIIAECGKLITYRIDKITSDFLAENLGLEAAIEYSINSLVNLQVLYEGLVEDFDDEIEKHIVNRKRQIADLEELYRKEKNKIPQLFWNDYYDLNNFSLALKDKEIISNHQDFINLFKSQSICILKKEMADYFVVLIYELLKKNPHVIFTGKKSGKGVKAVIDKFFRDDSIPVSKTISFRNRFNRIIQKGQEYDKLKAKVDKFLENHL